MGEKVGFTNCVFEKLSFSENTIFIVFSENTAVAIQTLYVNKKQKIDEKWWVVLNMAKGCFFVCFFFQALISLCFLCQVKLQEC